MNKLKKAVAIISALVMSFTILCSCSINNYADPQPIEELDTSKIERHPGIAIWGSSMGYGYYGRGSSILSSIDNHMMADECGIPVANMSVPQETNYTVLARAGATKMLVKSFTIPEEVEKVEVKIYSEDEKPIVPLRWGTEWDGGMSNVTIDGVEGTLSVDSNTAAFENPSYYFTRKSEGKKTKVKKGTEIISDSMTKNKDYIPIICMGDDGGWKTFDELIKQQQALLDSFENKDNYIILGLFSVPLTEKQEKSLPDDDDGKARAKLIKKNNEEYDKVMKEKWGEHYVSSREYLCSNIALDSIEQREIEYKNVDKVNMSRGIVPDILKYDTNTLNGTGYELVGDAVYKKMVDLGYLYN